MRYIYFNLKGSFLRLLILLVRVLRTGFTEALPIIAFSGFLTIILLEGSAIAGTTGDTVLVRTSESKGDMFEGNNLFFPEQDIILETHFGTMEIARHAVVIVSSSKTSLAVLDIHDNKKGDVALHRTDKVFKLAPGRHLLVTANKSDSFASANVFERVPHRNITKVMNTDEIQAFGSEFSLPETIDSVPSLKTLVASNDPETRKVSNKILKSIAVLMFVNSPQYKRYYVPHVTTLSSR